MSEKITLVSIAKKIKSTDDAILIVWDRQTGEYCVSYEGGAMHAKTFSALLANISQKAQGQTDKNGYWMPSLPKKNEDKKKWSAPWEMN